jgi:hypothetical protein
MTLGSHQTTVGRSQIHITPVRLLAQLGKFDLDPAAAYPRPWDCADHSIIEAQDGLSQPWPTSARVFLNPPFDRYVVGRWIQRLAEHGRGIALLHARTEAAWFEPCWQHASGILFMADRIHFYRPDGSRARQFRRATGPRRLRGGGSRLPANVRHRGRARDEMGTAMIILLGIDSTGKEGS